MKRQKQRPVHHQVTAEGPVFVLFVFIYQIRPFRLTFQVTPSIQVLYEGYNTVVTFRNREHQDRGD